MPLTHWACPPNKPTYGEAHKPEYCITECPHKCVSPFLIAALTKSERENHHRGKYISATSLGKCARKMKTEREQDFSDYMKNRLWAYRGTVIHTVMEDAASFELISDDDGVKQALLDLGYLVEWRMLIGFCDAHGGFRVPDSVSPYDESTWDAVTCPHCAPEDPAEVFLLGGTLDGFEPIWVSFDPETGVLHGVLWDLKTMADFALQLFVMGEGHKFNAKNKYHPNVKDDYVVQSNIYKYMGELSAPPPALRERGVKQLVFDESEIQGFGMKDFPRTGDVYPFKEHWRKPEKLWDIPSIEFWDAEDVESFIRENGLPIRDALILKLGRGNLIAPEDNKKGMHHWLCGLCPFLGGPACPNPTLEWDLIHEEGYSPEEAYQEALENPVEVSETTEWPDD